jgi:hypothetical protein
MGNEAPDAVVFSPDGATGYVVYPGTDSLVPFGTATGRAARPIRTGYYPLSAVVTPGGRRVYVASGGQASVTALRVATRTATAIKAGPRPSWPAVSGSERHRRLTGRQDRVRRELPRRLQGHRDTDQGGDEQAGKAGQGRRQPSRNRDRDRDRQIAHPWTPEPGSRGDWIGRKAVQPIGGPVP